MKPGTAKTKGRDTENLVVEWLRAHGVTHAERRRLTGSADQGDITGWPGVCIEVKSAAALRVPEWLAELAVEVDHSGAETGAVIARPKGKPDVDDWWVILPTGAWLDLMRAAGWIAEHRDPLTEADKAYLAADMTAVARVSAALRELDTIDPTLAAEFRAGVSDMDIDDLHRFADAIEAHNNAHRRGE